MIYADIYFGYMHRMEHTPMGTQPQHSPSPLFADVSEEAARLLLQHRIFTSVLRGLFPERVDPARIHAALDIGCGPGGWVLEVARTYAAMKRIAGIDSRPVMIERAQLQSWAAGSADKGLPHVEFQVMDLKHPLAFSARSFDYVRGQSLASFLVPADWSPLLDECLRLLRPGGVLCLIEPEFAGTTSPAFEEFSARFTQAFHRTGRSFTPGDQHLGITPVLKCLLQEAGFQQVEQHASVLNFSWGEQAHGDMYQGVIIGFKLLEDFLIQSQVIERKSFDHLYQQVLLEMQAPSFCGLLYLLTTWGKKPNSST